MRIKMLVATVDTQYVKLLSDNISEYHADIIEVSICSTLECLQETLARRKYDVALIDAEMIIKADLKTIHLPLLLWSEHEPAVDIPGEPERIQKYQRISSIVAAVLERYAKVSKIKHSSDSRYANITAVWSPAGGVGKTTVALAYTSSKVSDDKEVFYLNLETFSSVPGYFSENGKSISAAFEMLDSLDGNLMMLIQGICNKENGLTYLCSPDNFDDMCILSAENISELVASCARLADELVIDLSCVCDARTRAIFEIADQILIVTEPSIFAKVKLDQFISQNNVFEHIKEKTSIVANKGAIIEKPATDIIISFPLVQSNEAIEVCRILSGIGF